MEQELKQYLIEKEGEFSERWTSFVYSEDKPTEKSFIHKVGVLCAVDNNKMDWAHIVIGVKRSEFSTVEVKGYFNFSRGENDDMGAVMKRAIDLVSGIHPAFDY